MQPWTAVFQKYLKFYQLHSLVVDNNSVMIWMHHQKNKQTKSYNGHKLLICDKVLLICSLVQVNHVHIVQNNFRICIFQSDFVHTWRNSLIVNYSCLKGYVYVHMLSVLF